MTRSGYHAVIKSSVGTVSQLGSDSIGDLVLNQSSGQALLPEACPVCLHEPISKDDCKPNKALRTTIKIFMKKKIMERETAKKKEELSKRPVPTPVTPATPAANVTTAPGTAATTASSVAADPKVQDQISKPTEALEPPKLADLAAAESNLPTEAEKDVPQQSIEVCIQGHLSIWVAH